MKTLDDVKTFLEGQDGGIELYEAISSAISHERTTGKGLVADEKRRVERLNGALSKLGFDSASHELDTWLTDYTREAETGRKSKTKLSDTERRLVEIEKQLALEKNEKDKLKNKAKGTKIKEHLIKHFGDKLYSADDKAKLLILEGRVDLDENNNDVVWKDGDRITDFNTGLSNYLDENKMDMKNQQTGGAGGTSGDTSSGQKTMSFSAFDKLSLPERDNYISEGGKLTDN